MFERVEERIEETKDSGRKVQVSDKVRRMGIGMLRRITLSEK